MQSAGLALMAGGLLACGQFVLPRAAAETPAGGGTGAVAEGQFFDIIPEALCKRCDKLDRLQRLKENGGTPACEEAVVKSLRWLKTKQQPDGSWNGVSKTGMTGLALLAYFGHCETPASPEFGESCLKGITYLLNVGLKNNGRMADNFTANHWPYEHAIATQALAEAVIFCREIRQEVPSLLGTVGKAGQFIIDHQHENGGWAYGYATEGGHTDTSITAWQLQSLKACSRTSFKFTGMIASLSKSLKYLETCQNDNDGFGYGSSSNSANPDYFTLTGAGMFSHQMWGKGNIPGVRKAGRYVMDNTEFDYNGKSCDLYGHYYESLAMMQMGGGWWKKYNAIFRDQLLNNQNADGSWKVPGGGQRIRAVAPVFTTDPVYRTCLCTLMLEVYYRFLPPGVRAP